MNLKPETLSRIDEVITHYPVKRSATLPLLHLIQEDVGYIPEDAITWIAAKLELEPINVYEVVTFYPMFRRQPIGRSTSRSAARSPAPCWVVTRPARRLRRNSTPTAARSRPMAR
jgi:NADH:ubiquinone oxidoreductase subunit E